MPRGGKKAKPARAEVEAELAVLRKSLKNEASRRRQLEKGLEEAQEQQTASAEVLQTRNRELEEAQERQTAIAAILRVISISPTNTQPAFDAIVASAVRLCGGRSGGLYRLEAGVVHLVADASPQAEAYAPIRAAYPKAVDEVELTTRRIYTEGVISHLADVEAEPGLSDEFRERARVAGYRSIVGVPMVREGM